MRLPAGAPVPFGFKLRQKIPSLSKLSNVPTGTLGVVVTVLITGIAVFSVCVYPKMNSEYYKEAQARERALINSSREELAQGQNVWKDPFGKK